MREYVSKVKEEVRQAAAVMVETETAIAFGNQSNAKI
jgi:hypothetical protein